MKNQHYLTILFLSLFTVSCSEKLSREEAAQIITEGFGFPKEEVRTLQLNLPRPTKVDYALDSPVPPPPRKDSYLQNLVNAGLLKYNIVIEDPTPNIFYCNPQRTNCNANQLPGLTEIRRSINSYYIHHVEVSDELKRYEVQPNQVKVADLVFNGITGIVEREGLNIAEVNYSVRRTNITPFGKIIFELNEEVISKSVEFTKYDDGWRLN